jgi:hypothetical protein
MNTNLGTYSKNDTAKYQQSGFLLDKLGHLDQKSVSTPTNKGKDVLISKAKKKFFTQELCRNLLKTEDETLHKAYLTTMCNCCKVMEVKDNRVRNAVIENPDKPHERDEKGNIIKRNQPISIYCKSRWCLICNGIKTAHLINAYLPILKTWDNPFFVTLTTELTDREKAREEIKRKLHLFTLITRKAKRDKHEVKLFRNVEATFNQKKNKFHIHIHCLVSNEALAKMILNEWIKRNNKQGFECVYEAQKVKRADKNENSLKEIFKYATKMITKNRKGERVVYLNALNELFIAFRNVRTFQAYGVNKIIDEDKAFEELQADELTPGLYQNDLYTWQCCDWQSVIYDDVLSCYEPDQNMIKIINSFVLNEIDTS